MSVALITAAGILLVGSITTLLIRDGRAGIEYLKADLRDGDPDGLAYMGLIIAPAPTWWGADMTTKQIDHVRAVKNIRRRLQRLGIAVSAGPVGVDLVASGATVMVRGARQTPGSHTVTAKGTGKVYRYRYLRRMWNFHVHGKVTQAPDFWVLVELDGLRRVFVVPGGEINGRRKTAHQHENGGHRGNWFERFENQWGAVVRQQRRAA